MQLSSIIIAKNEEQNIGRCVESQVGVVDEIIVLVDSKTTDRTADIAGTFDVVTVLSVEWEGYAATKQKGLEKVTSDWVFWIDADEALTPELRRELLKFKQSAPEHDAYSVPRKAYFLGTWIRYSGWYPGRVTRLFNRNTVSFSDHDVHETLVVKGSRGELQYPLDHFTDPDIHHYYEKFNRYTSLAASELQHKKKTVTLSDMVLRSIAVFLKMYIFKRGFLDGTHGLMLAVFSANYVFTKYAKAWELQRKGENG